jgi:ribose transport system ATP-binding protein
VPGAVALLDVRGVAKRYGPVVALRSADLAVEPGEVHALLGANGAGKSTLVKVLTGVIRADAGTIEVEGEPVTIGSPRAARARGFAPVFQDPALVPDLTVTQNLRLTATDAGAVREWMSAMKLEVDLTEMAGELPLPTRSPRRCRPTSPSACSASCATGAAAGARCCSSPTAWPR